MATDALWALRSDGTISYHGPEGEICKVRVVSGYGSRSLEPKTAEFQLRKMRSSITYHQVPERTWHTDWKNPKTWFLPEGNWAKRVCIARWNSKAWKLELLKDIMATSKLWRSIRFHWNIMIDSKSPDEDFEYETEE